MLGELRSKTATSSAHYLGPGAPPHSTARQPSLSQGPPPLQTCSTPHPPHWSPPVVAARGPAVAAAAVVPPTTVIVPATAVVVPAATTAATLGLVGRVGALEARVALCQRDLVAVTVVVLCTAWVGGEWGLLSAAPTEELDGAVHAVVVLAAACCGCDARAAGGWCLPCASY